MALVQLRDPKTPHRRGRARDPNPDLSHGTSRHRGRGADPGPIREPILPVDTAAIARGATTLATMIVNEDGSDAGELVGRSTMTNLRTSTTGEAAPRPSNLQEDRPADGTKNGTDVAGAAPIAHDAIVPAALAATETPATTISCLQ